MIHYKETKQINQKNLKELYTSVGWISYTRELDILEKAIKNSLAVTTAWHNERLVGLVRTIGDGHTILYIQDILVHPDFQHQGIGTKLMTRALDTYKHVRQKVLLTEDAPDVRYFYESFGFTSCDKGNAVAFYKEY